MLGFVPISAAANLDLPVIFLPEIQADESIFIFEKSAEIPFVKASLTKPVKEYLPLLPVAGMLFFLFFVAAVCNNNEGHTKFI